MFPTGGIAARDEQSLLFSVEELKKAATMRPPPPSPEAHFVNGQRVSPRIEEEGGVIDLAPMLSAGGAVKSRTEPLYTAVSETGHMGFTLSVPPQRKASLAMFGAAAAASVLMLAAAVGIGVAIHGSGKKIDDVASSSNTPSNAPNAVAAAAMPGADAPSSDVVSPASKSIAANTVVTGVTGTSDNSPGSSAASAAPVKAQTVSTRSAGKPTGGARSWKMPANTQRVQSGGSSFTPKASAPPAPPSPPKARGGGKRSAADPCGCGGNLQCAMKCGL